MMRESGNSPRMAMIASRPLISGICRSISVTSGECTKLLNRLPAVRALGDDLHVRLAGDERRDAAAQQRMIVDRQDSNELAHEFVRVPLTDHPDRLRTRATE